ncbi:hypothetical protein QJQ45_029656, partial [Haematococcus lacustris]
LGLVQGPEEVQALAASVPDTGGVYFVPAFSGLLAPRWDASARGAILGLTALATGQAVQGPSPLGLVPGHSTKAHIARAMLEAICFQTREVLDAMRGDADLAGLQLLRVDGGATKTARPCPCCLLLPLALPLQADLMQVTVSRPHFQETTALGAALAAGLGAGVWAAEDVFAAHAYHCTDFSTKGSGGKGGLCGASARHCCDQAGGRLAYRGQREDMRAKNLAYFVFSGTALAFALPMLWATCKQRPDLVSWGAFASTAAIVVRVLYEQHRVVLEATYLIGLCMPFAIFIHLCNTGVDDLFYQAILHLCLIPFIDLPVGATVLGAACLTPMYLALDWHSLRRQGLAPSTWGLLLQRQAACSACWVGGVTLVHALAVKEFGAVAEKIQSGANTPQSHGRQSMSGMVQAPRGLLARLEFFLLRIKRSLSANDCTLVLALLFVGTPLTCFLKFISCYSQGTKWTATHVLLLLAELPCSLTPTQELLCDLLPAHVVHLLMAAGTAQQQQQQQQQQGLAYAAAFLVGGNRSSWQAPLDAPLPPSPPHPKRSGSRHMLNPPSMRPESVLMASSSSVAQSEKVVQEDRVRLRRRHGQTPQPDRSCSTSFEDSSIRSSSMDAQGTGYLSPGHTTPTQATTPIVSVRGHFHSLTLSTPQPSTELKSPLGPPSCSGAAATTAHPAGSTHSLLTSMLQPPATTPVPNTHAGGLASPVSSPGKPTLSLRPIASTSAPDVQPVACASLPTIGFLDTQLKRTRQALAAPTRHWPASQLGAQAAANGKLELPSPAPVPAIAPDHVLHLLQRLPHRCPAVADQPCTATGQASASMRLGSQSMPGLPDTAPEALGCVAPSGQSTPEFLPDCVGQAQLSHAKALLLVRESKPNRATTDASTPAQQATAGACGHSQAAHYVRDSVPEAAGAYPLCRQGLVPTGRPRPGPSAEQHTAPASQLQPASCSSQPSVHLSSSLYSGHQQEQQGPRGGQSVAGRPQDGKPRKQWPQRMLKKVATTFDQGTRWARKLSLKKRCPLGSQQGSPCDKPALVHLTSIASSISFTSATSGGPSCQPGQPHTSATDLPTGGSSPRHTAQPRGTHGQVNLAPPRLLHAAANMAGPAQTSSPTMQKEVAGAAGQAVRASEAPEDLAALPPEPAAIPHGRTLPPIPSSTTGQGAASQGRDCLTHGCPDPSRGFTAMASQLQADLAGDPAWSPAASCDILHSAQSQDTDMSQSELPPLPLSHPHVMNGSMSLPHSPHTRSHHTQPPLRLPAAWHTTPQPSPPGGPPLFTSQRRRSSLTPEALMALAQQHPGSIAAPSSFPGQDSSVSSHKSWSHLLYSALAGPSSALALKLQAALTSNGSWGRSLPHPSLHDTATLCPANSAPTQARRRPDARGQEVEAGPRWSWPGQGGVAADANPLPPVPHTYNESIRRSGGSSEGGSSEESKVTDGEEGGDDGLSDLATAVSAQGGGRREGLQLPRGLPSLTHQLAEWHENISIIFSVLHYAAGPDVVGFTDMAQKVHPQLVMTMLNDMYTRFDDLCLASGNAIYKVETIGDSLMAAAGLMHPDPDHAATAVRFALAMRKAAAKVMLPTTGQPVQIRIGVHSGRAMSGIVGKLRRRFCLFGDTVNTASRMESSGEAGAVHISQHTYSLIAHLPAFQFLCRGSMEIKGKGQMTTWWVEPKGSRGSAKLRSLPTNPLPAPPRQGPPILSPSTVGQLA